MENLPVYDVYVLGFMNKHIFQFQSISKARQSPIPRDPAAQPPASLFWTHNRTFHCEIVDTSHVFAWIPLHPPRYGQHESSDFAAQVDRGP